MIDNNNVSIIPADRLPSSNEVTSAQDRLIERLGSGKRKKYIRFVIAALSSIPWIGSVIGATASFSAESDQESLNDLEHAKPNCRARGKATK
jgi:hypothetical protein